MIDHDLTITLLVNRGRCHNDLFRAADELLAMHPLRWWERPLLRFVRWWHSRELSEVLDLLPMGRRNEVFDAGPE